MLWILLFASFCVWLAWFHGKEEAVSEFWDHVDILYYPLAMVGVVLFVHQSRQEIRSFELRALIAEVREERSLISVEQPPSFPDFANSVDVLLALSLWSAKSNSEIICDPSHYGRANKYRAFDCGFIKTTNKIRSRVQAAVDKNYSPNFDLLQLTCRAFRDLSLNESDDWEGFSEDLTLKQYPGGDRPSTFPLLFATEYGFPHRSFYALDIFFEERDYFNPNSIDPVSIWWYSENVAVDTSQILLSKAKAQSYFEFEDSIVLLALENRPKARQLLAGVSSFPFARFLVDDLNAVFLQTLDDFCPANSQNASREIFEAALEEARVDFESRLLPFDQQIAELEAELYTRFPSLLDGKFSWSERLHRASLRTWPYIVIVALCLKIGRYFAFRERKKNSV